MSCQKLLPTPSYAATGSRHAFRENACGRPGGDTVPCWRGRLAGGVLLCPLLSLLLLGFRVAAGGPRKQPVVSRRRCWKLSSLEEGVPRSGPLLSPTRPFSFWSMTMNSCLLHRSPYEDSAVITVPSWGISSPQATPQDRMAQCIPGHFLSSPSSPHSCVWPPHQRLPGVGVHRTSPPLSAPHF